MSMWEYFEQFELVAIFGLFFDFISVPSSILLSNDFSAYLPCFLVVAGNHLDDQEVNKWNCSGFSSVFTNSIKDAVICCAFLREIFWSVVAGADK